MPIESHLSRCMVRRFLPHRCWLVKICEVGEFSALHLWRYDEICRMCRQPAVGISDFKKRKASKGRF